MHVYSTGHGPTLVLLPGWSCGSPSAEFAPLAERLKNHFTVVIAEPLGYGWSDAPNRPRSCENMLEELRAGLRGAGAKPPYFLAGHSIAGVLMTFYAAKHPEELSGVAYLDAHTPPFYLNHREPGDQKFKAMAMLARLGVYRLMASLPKARAQRAMMMNDYKVYTKAQRAQMEAFAKRAAFRPGVMDEYGRIEENSRAAGNEIPSGVPAVLFTSSQFMTMFAGNMPAEEKAFIETNRAAWRVLRGGHYLHAFCPDLLASLLISFAETGALLPEQEA